MPAGRFDGGGIEHLGAVRCHVEGGFIADFRDGAGSRDDLGVGGHDAGHVRPYLQVHGLHRRCEKGRAVVGAAAAEGDDLAVGVAGDESRSHEYAYFGMRRDEGADSLASGVKVHRAAYGAAAGSRDHEVAGVHPQRLVALAGELARKYAGGKQFAERFDHRGDAADLGEEFAALAYRLRPLVAGEKPGDDGEVPVPECVDHVFGVLGLADFYEGVGTTADCGADKQDPVLCSGLLDYVEDAGHRGGAGDRRSAEFQYYHNPY